MEPARYAEAPDQFGDELPENAPLWAQMLWTLTRRQLHASNNQAQVWDRRFSELNRAVAGHAQTSIDAHEELVATVRDAIGKPADEDGHGGSGLAGEVSILRQVLGREPDDDGIGGRGVLGRLASHERHRTAWDTRWAQLRAIGASVAFCGAVLWFILSEKLGQLFKVH